MFEEDEKIFKLSEHFNIIALIFNVCMLVSITIVSFSSIGETHPPHDYSSGIAIAAFLVMVTFFMMSMIMSNNVDNSYFGHDFIDEEIIDWKFIIIGFIFIIYTAIKIVTDIQTEHHLSFISVLFGMRDIYIPSIMGFMAGDKKYWNYLKPMLFKLVEKNK